MLYTLSTLNADATCSTVEFTSEEAAFAAKDRVDAGEFPFYVDAHVAPAGMLAGLFALAAQDGGLVL